MVIKGGARGGPADLAKHLKRTDENERVTLIGAHGLEAQDIAGALAEMHRLGSEASTARRTLYHASINVGVNDPMTEERWAISRQALMEARGAKDQPFIEVEHEKKGRIHRHIVWLNIDLEHGRAISDSHNYRQHEEVARTLERQFGHDLVQGAHVERDGERPERTPSYAEMQQAKRSGIDPQEAKEFASRLWQTTDSGKAFAAALDESGWILARGDKRDFVLIDPSGETHSLGRRVGEKAAAVRERMADLDPASLPSVEQAKATQQERQLAASIDRQAEQAMQGAHAAAKGRRDDIRPGIFDRDAVNQAWLDAVAAAGIKHSQSAAQEARQPPEPTAGMEEEARGGAGACPDCAKSRARAGL